MAVQELFTVIAPKAVAQLKITSPVAKSLSTCRIYGSNDPTYGTVGWTPPLDGSAFAVLKVKEGKNREVETNRLWMTYGVDMFLGIAHADTANVNENYNNEALGWMDSMMQFIAGNRRLAPESLAIDPMMGDVQWCYDTASVREQHPVYGIPYYGVLFVSSLRIVYAVNYQT